MSKTETIRTAITKLDERRAKAPADQQSAIEIARTRMVRALEFSPAIAAAMTAYSDTLDDCARRGEAIHNRRKELAAARTELADRDQRDRAKDEALKAADALVNDGIPSCEYQNTGRRDYVHGLVAAYRAARKVKP